MGSAGRSASVSVVSTLPRGMQGHYLWSKDTKGNSLQAEGHLSFRQVQLAWGTQHGTDHARGETESGAERPETEAKKTKLMRGYEK